MGKIHMLSVERVVSITVGRAPILQITSETSWQKRRKKKLVECG
jgi:hypothetical protein